MTTRESTGSRHDEARVALVRCFFSVITFSSPDTGKGSVLNVGSTDQMRHYPGGQNRNPSSTFFGSSHHNLTVR